MKGYSFKRYDHENMARATGLALPISLKQSVEICRFIKNRSISDAKAVLQKVMEQKTPIPFRRYNWDLGHKKNAGPARYPKSASKEIIKLIESVEANAQFKGINTSHLKITHINAHNAGKAWHYGRKSRRRMKRTNIEIVVEESKNKTDAGKQAVKQKND